MAEKALHWEGPYWSYFADFNVARRDLDRIIDKIRRGLEADRIIMVLSDYTTPQWRYEVMEDYKSNRTTNRRPILWGAVREYIHDCAFDGQWEVQQFPYLEGDDVIGVRLTEETDEERIAVSIDKDMKTLPGLHLHMDDAINFDDDDLLPLVYEISEPEADLFHMTQAIAGDQVDGYPGCPGIGMVRAERFLKGGQVLEPYEHTFSRGARKGDTELRWEPARPGTFWEIARSIYESKGLTKEDALNNARVARILRDGEFCPDTGEVTLWTP